jgi:uncharacterized protein (TIGR04222 family)
MELLTGDVLADAGDTWGVSGPVFLVGYAGAALVLFGLALTVRWRARRGRPPREDLTPYELAYLVGGIRRTAGASVAALRAEGAVKVTDGGRLRAVHEPRNARTELDRAVFAEIRRLDGPGIRQVGNMAKVQSAARRIGDGLVAEGLLAGPAERVRARLATVPLLLMAAAGVVRLVAGPQDRREVWVLAVATIVVVVVTAVLWRRTPGLLRAGTAAVEAARTRNAHLDPSMSPAWTTYGVEGAALGVALFGAAALTDIDPLFAGELGLAISLGARPQLGTASGGASCASARDYAGGMGCGGGGGGGGGGGD